MSQSQAKYHRLDRPDEVTNPTTYKKHTSRKLSIVPGLFETKFDLTKIKESMNWSKATFKEKLAITAVFLTVLAVCLVLIFEFCNKSRDKEGRHIHCSNGKHV